MLLQVMKHSALSAKVHAMTGTTLHQADYNALLSLQSVPAVAAYLNENTRYHRCLSHVSLTGMHRGQLEQRLKNQMLQDVIALLHYTDQNNALFLKTLEVRDGIEKLKLFFRLLAMGQPELIVEQSADIPTGSSFIKTSALAEIKSFSAFMDFIRNTPYYPVFRTFANDPARQEQFYLEVALDTFWARLIVRCIKKTLAPEDRKPAMKLFGTEIDLDNLSFLLRCNERFQMAQEEIFACVIPVYHQLKPTIISDIVQAPTTEDAIKIIAEKTPYGKAFHQGDRFFEKRKNEYLAQLYHKVYTSNPYSLHSALAYAQLRRIEINNIVSIIEGIRYGLNPEQIRKGLVGYEKGGALS